MSRRHAALLCSGGRVLVEDLGSRNGTRVNDTAVTATTPLTEGDAVSFADVLLHFGEPRPTQGTLTLDPHRESAGQAVSWDEVSVRPGTGQRKRSELFRCLARAGDLLTVPGAPEELFEPILDLVESAMDPERAFLLLVDADRDAPRIRASRLRGGIDASNVTLSHTMVAPLFDNKRVIGILYADTTDPTRHYTRDELPEIPGYEVCAHIEPCFEVGGDLYDVSTLSDGRVAVVVGDVAGKGLGAALLVSSLVPLLRAMLEAEPDLAALTANLNRQLWRTTDPMRYSTLFVGVLEPATGRLEYVNAGHNPPVLVRADGALESVGPTGLPVALMGEGTWRAGELALRAGDQLALYSDGIPETWRNEEEDYGDERFQKLLLAQRGRPVAAVRDAVTLVLLRRLP